MHFTATLTGIVTFAVFAIAAPSELSANSAAATWTDYGCWTEATTGRALSSDSLSNSIMTAEVCQAYCGTKYQYIGVEYGREWYVKTLCYALPRIEVTEVALSIW